MWSIGFSAPVYLWLLVGIVPLTLFFFLAPRRVRRHIPFVGVWKQAVEVQAQSAMGRRLRRVLEWILAMLALTAVSLAAAGLHVASTSPPRPIVMLVDNSSSMQRSLAGETETTLLDRAFNRAKDLLSDVAQDVPWTVVALAPEPSRVASGTGSAAVDVLRAVPEPAPLRVDRTRLDRYLASLKNVHGDEATPAIVLLTDRQLPGLKHLAKTKADLRVVPVGEPAPNLAVTDAQVRTDWKGIPERVRVTVRNYSARRRRVMLRADGPGWSARELSLGAGGIDVQTYAVPDRGSRARRAGFILDAGDAFSQDDAAYVQFAGAGDLPVRVRVEQSSEPFVRALLRELSPPFTPVWNGQETGRDSSAGEAAPVHLVSGEAAEVPSREARIVFQLTGTESTPGGRRIVSQLNDIEVNRSDDLVSNLDFGELQVEQAGIITMDRKETGLIRCASGWLAVRGTDERGNPYVRVGFSLSDSNIMRLPEFPIFMRNVFAWFLRRRGPRIKPSIRAGEPVSMDGLKGTSLRHSWIRDDGTIASQRLRPGDPPRSFDRPGWYRVDTPDASSPRWAVNFFYPAESRMNRTGPPVDPGESILPPDQLKKTDVPRLRTLALLMAVAALLVFWGLQIRTGTRG